MSKLVRISDSDIKTIRDIGKKVASRYTRSNKLQFEIGERCNTENRDRESSVNIFLVSDDPEWNDTDLTQPWGWELIRKPIEITDDGRILLDIYISDHNQEMVCNIQPEFDQVGLKAVHADSNKNVWIRN